MAWPFGSAGNDRDADAELAEERLKIMANVAIEQVPLPEQGELSEEDAWTISPGPTRARLNSIGSVPTVAATLAPQPAAPVNAQVDTSGLERMISSRLDMVEDVLGLISHKMEQANIAPTSEDGESSQASEEGEVVSVDGAEGDTIVTADGEVLQWVAVSIDCDNPTKHVLLNCTKHKRLQRILSLRRDPMNRPQTMELEPQWLQLFSLTTSLEWLP